MQRSINRKRNIRGFRQIRRKYFVVNASSSLSEQSLPPTWSSSSRASVRGDIEARATSVSRIASRTRVRTRRTTACTRISRAMTNRASAACGRANPSTSDRDTRPPGISRAGPHYVPRADAARCLRRPRGSTMIPRAKSPPQVAIVSVEGDLSAVRARDRDLPLPCSSLFLSLDSYAPYRACNLPAESEENRFHRVLRGLGEKLRSGDMSADTLNSPTG